MNKRHRIFPLALLLALLLDGLAGTAFAIPFIPHYTPEPAKGAVATPVPAIGSNVPDSAPTERSMRDSLRSRVAPMVKEIRRLAARIFLWVAPPYGTRPHDVEPPTGADLDPCGKEHRELRYPTYV